MRKSNHNAIRDLLRNNPDGLTTASISRLLDVDTSSSMRALKVMPDAYIDRWQQSGKRKFAAVWCAVIPPAHCPHPRQPESQDHGHHAA